MRVVEVGLHEWSESALVLYCIDYKYVCASSKSVWEEERKKRAERRVTHGEPIRGSPLLICMCVRKCVRVRYNLYVFV